MVDAPIVYVRKTLADLYQRIVTENKPVECPVEIEGLVSAVVIDGNNDHSSQFILRDDLLLLRLGVKEPLMHAEHVAFVFSNRKSDTHVFECFLRNAQHTQYPVIVHGHAYGLESAGMSNKGLWLYSDEVIIDGITFTSLPQS